MSRFSDHEEDTGYNTAFQDMLFGIIGVIAVVAIILLIILRPVQQLAKATSDDDSQRGSVKMEISWANNLDVDIDLWGAAPGMTPVGYSNMHNQIMDLMRDDLGMYQDITDINYEMISARGLPPGEWTFNIYWYRNNAKVAEVVVNAVLTINYLVDGKPSGSAVKINIPNLVLTHVGQELTVIRFRIGPDGTFDRGSMTNIFKPIRAALPYSPNDPNGN